MAGSRDATIIGTYTQSSVRRRIEAFFLDNLGKIATRDQLVEVARDPETGRAPENWHPAPVGTTYRSRVRHPVVAK